MLLKRSVLLSLLMILLSPLFANARAEGYQLSVGAGYLKPSNPRAAFQIEGKGDSFWHCLRPQVGLLTEEFHSLLVYGGAGIELELFKDLYFFPSFSPAIYFQGKGVRLGYPVEFRSCLELIYQINCKYSVGSQFFHLSNGALAKHNPGVNALIFYLSLTSGIS